MNYKDLQNAGLNETEAKIYLAVLELGETVISRIAKKSGIKRTTVYLSLDNLKERGIISQIKKRGRQYYFAEDPRHLIDIMEEKKDKIAKLMPEILSIANLIDKKPVIRYFEGKEAFKEIYNDTLRYSNQELLIWFTTDESWLNDEYYSKNYIPKRLAKKIYVKGVVADSAKNMKFFQTNIKDLRTVKLAPSNLYDSKIEIILYEKNKIGIVSFHENLGIIIESPDIHKALKSIFEVMWSKLPD
jgi:sugar-specific transcriptional regulator TrmB